MSPFDPYTWLTALKSLFNEMWGALSHRPPGLGVLLRTQRHCFFAAVHRDLLLLLPELLELRFVAVVVVLFALHCVALRCIVLCCVQSLFSGNAQPWAWRTSFLTALGPQWGLSHLETGDLQFSKMLLNWFLIPLSPPFSSLFRDRSSLPFILYFVLLLCFYFFCLPPTPHVSWTLPLTPSEHFFQ